MKKTLFLSKQVFRGSLLIIIVCLLQKVQGHAGIINPKSMRVGREFATQCGQKAAGIIKNAPFISQELWKRASPQCAKRRCQGLFVEDQDLSRVPSFSSNEESPVTIQVQVPHGGNAQLVLMDMKAESQVGPPLLKMDKFGTRNQKRRQTFSVSIPQNNMPQGNCGQAGDCAIAFQWLVRRTETYEICSLITLSN